MESKILEVLLDIQKDMKELKTEVENIGTKVNKLESKMIDSFETLELLSEINATEINRLKIRVAKVEKRISEINKIS